MELLNTNPHRVEVDGTPSTRLSAGQARNFEGEAADAVLAIDGVFESDSEEAREYLEAHQESLSDHPGARHLRLAAMSRARVTNRLLSVASLRTVIGDDEAPYGPSSGTITTKAAVARQSPEDRRAFADNEALPEDKDLSRAPQRAAQGEHADAAEEIADAVLDATTPGYTADPGASADQEPSREDDDEPRDDDDPDLGSDDDGDDDDPPLTPSEQVPDYDGITVAELDQRLRDRGLSLEGNKREKFDRLYTQG